MPATEPRKINGKEYLLLKKLLLLVNGIEQLNDTFGGQTG
jgi:hypothetical protein